MTKNENQCTNLELSQDKVCSQGLKLQMLNEMLFSRQHIVGVTECSLYKGVADILVCSKAGFTHEIEVKVSKQDLKSEIDCIHIILGQKQQEKYFEKLHKHMHYLQETANKNNDLFNDRFMIYYNLNKTDHTPNKFSFCVPPNLAEYAMKSLDGTPYGLYICHKNFVEEKIKPNYLHKNKILDEHKDYLLRKCSTEIFYTRQKLNELSNKLIEL